MKKDLLLLRDVAERRGRHPGAEELCTNPSSKYSSPITAPSVYTVPVLLAGPGRKLSETQTCLRDFSDWLLPSGENVWNNCRVRYVCGP